MRAASENAIAGESIGYPLTFDEMSYNEQTQVFDTLMDEGLECDDIVFGVYRRTNTGVLLVQIGAIH